MANTPTLGMPLIDENLAGKALTHNQAIRDIEAILAGGVKSQGDNTPPGSPVDGDAYIIGTSATGDWAGQDENITYWDGSAWQFLTPREGLTLWVDDVDEYFRFEVGSPGGWISTGIAGAGSNALLKENNLSDVQSAATSRTNLGLGTAATKADTRYAHRANNLSDLASAPTSRTNLGLGTAAVANTGTADAEVPTNADLGDAVILKAPTRAEWEAMAARRRTEFGGSGFVEWGRHATVGETSINQGMRVKNGDGNQIRIGRGGEGGPGEGRSRTNEAVCAVNGALLNIRNVRQVSSTFRDSDVRLSAAPATSSLLSRQDLVFLEVWHEKITDKDVVYPYGAVQYGVTSWEGISLTQPIDASYSAFGQWEVDAGGATAGRGRVWSTASDANKEAFIKDPRNNIYSDGGELRQVRYRVKVLPDHVGLAGTAYPFGLPLDLLGENTTGQLPVQGARLSEDALSGSSSASTSARHASVLSLRSSVPGRDDGLWANWTASDRSETFVYVIPIALVQRRNQGAYHPTHNPSGCARFLDTDGTTESYWYETDQTISNAADCFTHAVGGSIGENSGRPGGLFENQIAARDLEDLRNDANRVPDWDRRLTQIREDLLTNGYNSHRKELVSETAATGATLSRKAQAVHFGVDGSTQVAVTLNSSTNVVTHSGSASTVVYYDALEDLSASSSITDWLRKGLLAADTDDRAASMLIEAAHSTVPTGSTTDSIAISKEADAGALTLAETAAQTWQFAFNLGRKNGKAYAVVNYDSSGALDRTARKLEFELQQFALAAD